MKSIVAILLLMLMIDGFLFMGQSAILDANPGGTQFYDYNGTLIHDADAGNHTVKSNQTSILGELPSGQSSVSPETGNIFTDIFNSITGWIGDTTGYNYVKRVVTAFPNFLQSIGVPNDFAFIVGAMWHLFTLFLIALLILGRD